MTFKSMTGYGRGKVHDSNTELTIELNSVNRKNTDFFLSGPREWQGAERFLVERLRKDIKRGQIVIVVRVKSNIASNNFLTNEKMLHEIVEKFKHLAEKQGIAYRIDLTTLFQLSKELEPSHELPDWDQKKDLLEKCLEQALENLIKMREHEGRVLAEDIKKRLKIMKKLVQQIEKKSNGSTLSYRDTLIERLHKMGIAIDLNDERLLKELSLFADRCDISEELTRLRSHLDQMEACIEAIDPIGRKMDFICQEINRELNTVASKSMNLEVTQDVIESKNELERIREQVQNVE